MVVDEDYIWDKIKPGNILISKDPKGAMTIGGKRVKSLIFTGNCTHSSPGGWTIYWHEFLFEDEVVWISDVALQDYKWQLNGIDIDIR